MLALTRKKGEALVINNNIEITVLEIRGDQIKLGITAPKDVPVSADSERKPGGNQPRWYRSIKRNSWIKRKNNRRVLSFY